jgi:hypothetical protein
MLRHNARATEIARVALIAIRDGADPETALRTMQQSWMDMLPNVKARRLLVAAIGNAPHHYAEIIGRLGLGFMVTHLTHVWAYPRHWRESPAWAGYVDRYRTLWPPPPEPDTFRDRMLRAPWELTDNQAEFVTDHRYDVGTPHE